jgi:hypothetical protein
VIVSGTASGTTVWVKPRPSFTGERDDRAPGGAGFVRYSTPSGD